MPASQHSKPECPEASTPASQISKPTSQQASQKQASKKSPNLPSQQASNHATTISKNHRPKLSGRDLSTNSFPIPNFARKSNPNQPKIIRKRTNCERKSFPNPPKIIYCEQVVAVNLIKGDMHENQPIPLDPKRPATHRKSAANQLQIIANHMICRLPHSMLFDPLICTDLQLICTLQITAKQSLSTFKKHCKTHANHCKSRLRKNIEKRR